MLAIEQKAAQASIAACVTKQKELQEQQQRLLLYEQVVRKRILEELERKEAKFNILKRQAQKQDRARQVRRRRKRDPLEEPARGTEAIRPSAGCRWLCVFLVPVLFSLRLNSSLECPTSRNCTEAQYSLSRNGIVPLRASRPLSPLMFLHANMPRIIWSNCSESANAAWRR